MTQFVNVGFNNMVNASRIASVRPVVKSELNSIMMAMIDDRGLLLDFSNHRKTVTVIKMDSGHHIYSAVKP